MSIYLPARVEKWGKKAIIVSCRLSLAYHFFLRSLFDPGDAGWSTFFLSLPAQGFDLRI